MGDSTGTYETSRSGTAYGTSYEPHAESREVLGRSLRSSSLRTEPVMIGLEAFLCRQVTMRPSAASAPRMACTDACCRWPSRMSSGRVQSTCTGFWVGGERVGGAP